MSKFKYIWLLILLLSAPVFADSAGSYYDPKRNGEGVNVFEVDGVRTFWFYGYHDNNNTRLSQLFLYASHPIDENGVSTGHLYITESLNYPECQLAQGDIRYCAYSESIGIYTMIPEGDGYVMSVENLAKNDWTDSLFSTIYTFTTPVFKALTGEQK